LSIEPGFSGVETNTSDEDLDKNLVYFKEKGGATQALQVVMKANGL